MAEYDIPLSTIYAEGRGPRVEIRTGRNVIQRHFYVTNRRGDGPDDLVSLSDSEVEQLVHIGISYLNRTNAGTLSPEAKGEYTRYRIDSPGSDSQAEGTDGEGADGE